MHMCQYWQQKNRDRGLCKRNTSDSHNNALMCMCQYWQQENHNQVYAKEMQVIDY